MKLIQLIFLLVIALSRVNAPTFPDDNISLDQRKLVIDLEGDDEPEEEENEELAA